MSPGPRRVAGGERERYAPSCMSILRHRAASLRAWAVVAASVASATHFTGCMDGCSQLGRPAPTEQTVLPKHVIGTWSYGYDEARVEIREDGTFHQRTRTKDRKAIHEHEGRWTLDGALIEFRPFYFDASSGRDEPDAAAQFYMTDWRGPELDIFGGGINDEDCWNHWTRVEAVNPK